MIYFCWSKEMNASVISSRKSESSYTRCERAEHVTGLSSAIRLHAGMSLFNMKKHGSRGYYVDVSLLTQIKHLYFSRLEHNIFIIDKPNIDNNGTFRAGISFESYKSRINALPSLTYSLDISDPILEKEYKMSVVRYVYSKYYIPIMSKIYKCSITKSSHKDDITQKISEIFNLFNLNYHDSYIIQDLFRYMNYRCRR